MFAQAALIAACALGFGPSGTTTQVDASARAPAVDENTAWTIVEGRVVRVDVDLVTDDQASTAIVRVSTLDRRGLPRFTRAKLDLTSHHRSEWSSRLAPMERSVFTSGAWELAASGGPALRPGVIWDVRIDLSTPRVQANVTIPATVAGV